VLTLSQLFVIELKTRRVHVVGITRQADGEWTAQIACNLTDAIAGPLRASITPNGITKALAMSFPFRRPVLPTILVPSVAANGLADSSTSMNETPRESAIAFLGLYVLTNLRATVARGGAAARENSSVIVGHHRGVAQQIRSSPRACRVAEAKRAGRELPEDPDRPDRDVEADEVARGRVQDGGAVGRMARLRNGMSQESALTPSLLRRSQAAQPWTTTPTPRSSKQWVTLHGRSRARCKPDRHAQRLSDCSRVPHRRGRRVRRPCDITRRRKRWRLEH
jgi:hypothetical protein